VGGVDEAGRGSIIGPLVVAGVSVRKSRLAELRRMGVRDSKTLTPKSRERLFDDIVRLVDDVCIRKVEPGEVDESVMNRGLNRLEARMMAGVIDRLGADEIYVDSCDVNPSRYRRTVEHCMLGRPRKLHSIHHADSKSVAVSAASIVAKITRDREIQEIRSRYGPGIGSGYPSDITTMGFIRSWVQKNGVPPEFARKSWKPLRAMIDQLAQRTLQGP
jgi:ribonuclease HII